MSQKIKIRLYINQDLSRSPEIVPGEAQVHYLNNVLRLEDGAVLAAFDGINGEYSFRLRKNGKKSLVLERIEKLRELYLPPDLWLLFAPVKKDKTDFIIEKAGELGVRKIIPTITKHTISDRVKTERYLAQAVEACEQCRRVDVPEIGEPVTLSALLKSWDRQRILYYMDETGNGANIYQAFGSKAVPAAILVGPEGGFSPTELELLAAQDFTLGVSQGPRILRAETAAAAALSCWQAICGDWKNEE